MLKANKSQNVQKILVKKLHKDISKTKRELFHNKSLSKYDKENTNYFLLNVENQKMTPKPVVSKNSSVDNINVLCYKIMFYSKHYSIYQKYYDEFKKFNCEMLNKYRVFLFKLVSHLRVKKQSLINDLSNQKHAK